MKWTREHATYLENQIKRLDREYQDTDSDVVKEVVLRCKAALINLRRPTEVSTMKPLTEIKRHAVNETTRQIQRYGYTLSRKQAAQLGDEDWDWLRNVLNVRVEESSDGSVDLIPR